MIVLLFGLIIITTIHAIVKGVGMGKLLAVVPIAVAVLLNALILALFQESPNPASLYRPAHQQEGISTLLLFQFLSIIPQIISCVIVFNKIRLQRAAYVAENT